MPTITPTDPCPCESGKPAGSCCIPFGLGRAEPCEADTRPRGERTSFAHARCYAAALNDCSEDISREHYFSANILREMGATVVVHGFPWQKTAAQRVGVGSFTANILCTRHNEALSPLDALAGRLFRNLRATTEALTTGAGDEVSRLFTGVDLERWLLKVLLGIGSAKAARAPTGEALTWAPPEIWLRILFGRATFPSTWGLYVNARIGAELRLDPTRVSIAPMTTADAISGCVVNVAGLELLLVLTDVGPLRSGALDENSAYRPDALRFVEHASKTVRYLCFPWPRGKRGAGQLELTWPASARPQLARNPVGERGPIV